jgi:hypothetical protein
VLDISFDGLELKKGIMIFNFHFRFVHFIKHYLAGIISFLCTAVFFALYLSVFRLGYLVNDDITMISLVSGYLGGKPVPFMIYSNVIWGFLLIPLYAIHSNLNWEIWLFVIINFLSVWALVYVALSRPLHIIYKLAGILAILTCDGFFLSNITFTEIAAFAALAGTCLILMTVYPPIPMKRSLWICGGLLILIASLLRLDAVYLVLLAILPSALMMYRIFDIKKLALVCTVTSIMIAGCYVFNKIYVGLHPDWNSYYVYDRTREMIQDTPRAHIENIGNFLSDDGWSENDYMLFLNWYFPDQKVYSFSKLDYLVNHVSDSETSVSSAWSAYFHFHHIFNAPDTFPYLLIIFAAWFLSLVHQPLRRAVPALGALLASPLVLILYLVWKENVPLHVWYPFLSVIGVFSLCILSWNVNTMISTARSESRKGMAILTALAFFVTMSIALSFVLYSALVRSRVNIAKQSAYVQMLSELDSLQSQGKIASNALIISPAIGIPIEWSNPLILNLPDIHYFQMEWLTFSPIYDQVLRDYGVQSLPAGFYQNNNIYLITKTSIVSRVIQSIKANEGVNVKAELIYSPDNEDVALYRLILQK